MTVAAMIEIGAGGHSGSRGHSEPGQSLPGTNAAGKAQGAEWGGALGVSASTSFIPAAASFRSSWQSELASLNADLECSSKEGAAADQSSASTEGLTIESAQGNSATITTTSQSPSQRSGLENSKQIALTVGKENLSLAGTGSGIAIPRTAVGALRQPSSTPAPKSGATVSTWPKGGTAGNSQVVSSGKIAKSEAASGEVEANSIAAQSISLAIPASAGEVQPSGIMDAPLQIPLTDLSNELSSAFSSGSIQSASSFPSGLEMAPEGTIVAGNHAAGPLKMVADGRGAQSSHSYDPVTSTSAKSVNSGEGEEVTTVASGLHEKASVVRAKTSPTAEHGGLRGGNIEEVKSPATNGSARPTAREELSSSGRMRPQSEDSTHALTYSQPRPQAQPAIREVDTVAAPVGKVAMDRSSAVSNAASSQSAPVLDTAPTTDKAGPTGNSKATSVQSSSRSSHAAVGARGDRQGQALQTVQDGANSTALSRDPSAVRSALSLDAESAGAMSKNEPAARDTFAALDAGSSSGTTTWVHAGARSAEAGFQDPTLGWVGVRADASGGGVHASLVPGSAEAAVTLGGHLAGLNSYMAEHHTPIDSITLAAPEDRSANSGMGQGGQQSGHQGMNQEAGQNTGQGAPSSQQSSTRVSAPVSTGAASQEVSANSGRTEATARAFIPEGTHISVMA